jgi:predicted RNase H-like HicB family nuclease
MKYTVIIETSATGYGAYVPDLPGCIAAGSSREEVMELIKEAIEFHIRGLREQGYPIPQPSSESELVEITKV